MSIKQIYKAVRAYKKPLGITLAETLVHVRTYHKKFRLVKRKLGFIKSLHLTPIQGTVIDVTDTSKILSTCLKTPLSSLRAVKVCYEDGSIFERDGRSTRHIKGQQNDDISYAILHILSEK